MWSFRKCLWVPVVGRALCWGHRCLVAEAHIPGVSGAQHNDTVSPRQTFLARLVPCGDSGIQASSVLGFEVLGPLFPAMSMEREHGGWSKDFTGQMWKR